MTGLRLLPAPERTWVTWKNGGGEMCDVLVSPEGADLHTFDWRIGIARIDRDGPFSNFPDVDRTFMVVGGKGVRLDVEGLETARLTHKSPPYAFPGDRPATARLVDGTAIALNVMARRGAVQTRIGKCDGPARFVVGDEAITLLVWARGSAHVMADQRMAQLGIYDAAVLTPQAQVQIAPGERGHGWLIELRSNDG